VVVILSSKGAGGQCSSSVRVLGQLSYGGVDGGL